MQRDWTKLVLDMLLAAERITYLTRGKTEIDFRSDPALHDAVLLNFVVIGEALANLNKLDSAIARKFTDYQKIIGFRNHIVHGYFAIQDDITWNAVVVHLPVLMSEIRALTAGNPDFPPS